MIRLRSTPMFPVGLYAALLLAMLGLLRPALYVPLETALSSVACLPLRALGALRGVEPDRDGRERHAVADRHVAALWQRVARRDTARWPGERRGLVPVPAVVLARRGADGRRPPDRIVLSTRRDALGDAASYVTFGDALVGFLESAPLPPRAADGEPDPLAGHAVVRLLHHRVPRRVPASVMIPEHGQLRMLVEPAGGADDGLLRCTMFDDHYLAAQIGAEPLLVRTSGLVADPLGVLPLGLSVGVLRVFGYPMPGSDRVVPIDLQVEPTVPPDAVAHAVVWVAPEAPAARDVERVPDPLAGRPRLGVRVQRVTVPTAARTRWLATTLQDRFTRLHSGAAVVDGRRLVGVLDAAGLGFGVVAPFGQPERVWSLVIVPRDPARGTVALRARVTGRQGGVVRLAVLRDTRVAATEAVAGEVYTGGDGAALPCGLWIGAGQLGADGGLVVEHFDPAAMPPRLVVVDRRRAADADGEGPR